MAEAVANQIDAVFKEAFPLIEGEKRLTQLSQHNAKFWKYTITIPEYESLLVYAALASRRNIDPNTQDKEQPISEISKLLNNSGKLPFCSATYYQGFADVIEITFAIIP